MTKITQITAMMPMTPSSMVEMADGSVVVVLSQPRALRKSPVALSHEVAAKDGMAQKRLSPSMTVRA